MDYQDESGRLVADYDFDLPEELIAQEPPEIRGASRMLVLDRRTGLTEDRTFAELPQQLRPGDVLVLNDSRVIPARLFGRRINVHGLQDPTGMIEVMLTGPLGAGRWGALVRPGRKVKVGDHLQFPTATGEITLEAEVVGSGSFGERMLRFLPDALAGRSFFTVLDQIGHMPLPPYIGREDTGADRERYQTVYARERGSVAAPTAGLHFTPAMFAALAERGVEIVYVTLHVGLGTFAPLRVDRVDQVHLHRERYTLPAATADALNIATAHGRRVVAVGTTAVRTLEHCALEAGGKPLVAHSGETEIFISPGFEFRMVKAMLTNFHLPQSSLLMLVSAFAGRERVLAAYAHAVRRGYKFFSYGDCMFVG